MVMKRWDWLFVLLGCLALWSAAMPTVAPAAAWSDRVQSELRVDPVGARCFASGRLCASMNAGCATTCVNSGPTLSTFSAEAEALTAARLDPNGASTLQGLAPRPDPLPPRT